MKAQDIKTAIMKISDDEGFALRLSDVLKDDDINIKKAAKANHHLAMFFLENSMSNKELTIVDKAELICHHRENIWFMSELPEGYIKNLAMKDPLAAITILKAGMGYPELSDKDKQDIVQQHYHNRSFMRKLITLVKEYGLMDLIKSTPQVLLYAHRKRSISTNVFKNSSCVSSAYYDSEKAKAAYLEEKK